MCRIQSREPDAPDLSGDFVRRVARDFQLDAFRGDRQTLMTVLDDEAANELLHLALLSSDPTVATFATRMLTTAADKYADEELAKYENAQEMNWRAAA